MTMMTDGDFKRRICETDVPVITQKNSSMTDEGLFSTLSSMELDNVRTPTEQPSAEDQARKDAGKELEREALEFQKLVEHYMGELRGVDPRDLEARLMAAHLVAKSKQEVAGHLMWIDEWDPQCGQSYLSYCGQYYVTFVDNFEQNAYTPEGIYDGYHGEDYCELRYQALNLKPVDKFRSSPGYKWDTESWNRFTSWDVLLEWMETEEHRTKEQFIGLMRQWLIVDNPGSYAAIYPPFDTEEQS
jgi:hypothetical protein